MALKGRASPEVRMQLGHETISDDFVEQLYHEQVDILKRTCRFSLIQPEPRKLKLSLPTIDATYIEYWYEKYSTKTKIEDFLLICPAPGCHWMGPKWTYWLRFGGELEVGWSSLKIWESFRKEFLEFRGFHDCNHFINFIHIRIDIYIYIPSTELTYPIPKAPLKMIFLSPRWDMLIPWRVYIYIMIIYVNVYMNHH